MSLQAHITRPELRGPLPFGPLTTTIFSNCFDLVIFLLLKLIFGAIIHFLFIKLLRATKWGIQQYFLVTVRQIKRAREQASLFQEVAPWYCGNQGDTHSPSAQAVSPLTADLLTAF